MNPSLDELRAAFSEHCDDYYPDEFVLIAQRLIPALEQALKEANATADTRQQAFNETWDELQAARAEVDRWEELFAERDELRSLLTELAALDSDVVDIAMPHIPKDLWDRIQRLTQRKSLPGTGGPPRWMTF